MKQIVFLLVAAATVAGVVVSRAPASGQADGEAAPIYGIKLPPGYRDWKLISVAHEEGNLNEHPEPGGVNCSTRKSLPLSWSASSRHPSLL
jgi:hypothetical protein